MASTLNSPTTPAENKLMTWYACGQVLPANKSPGDFVLDIARKTMPNLVPTTYEAASAYLREVNGRMPDILREMCVILPMGLPKDRSVFLPGSFGILTQLEEFSMSFFPTSDFPPDSFGNPENMGILDSKGMLMFDPPVDTPQTGVILLSYFTDRSPES